MIAKLLTWGFPDSLITINQFLGLVVHHHHLVAWKRDECVAFGKVYADLTFEVICTNPFVQKRLGSSKLVDLVLPDSTEWIGDQSFKGCQSLASLTLPASLAHIGDEAFYGCQELRNVKVYHTEPLAINENVFENKAYQNGTLHVPVGCVEKYRAADGWKRFSRIYGDLPNPADVNGDGEINIADANNVIHIIVNGGGSGHGHAPSPEDGPIVGDVNGDGEVNMADVNAIIEMILTQ